MASDHKVFCQFEGTALPLVACVLPIAGSTVSYIGPLVRVSALCAAAVLRLGRCLCPPSSSGAKSLQPDAAMRPQETRSRQRRRLRLSRQPSRAGVRQLLLLRL